MSETEAPTKKIFDFLLKNNPPVRTLNLARCAFGAGSSCKTVNPILHKLQKEGFLEKQTKPDGTDPQWQLTEKGKAEAAKMSTEEGTG
jgi:predicted transcriptional regulator